MPQIDNRHADKACRTRRRWLYRGLNLIGTLFPFTRKMPEPASEPIDVVIPAVEKDLDILPLAIEGVRRQSLNRIAAIYIVAPDNSDLMKNAAERLNCVFVKESTVLGYSLKDMPEIVAPDGTDRRGWMFQQLLKLSGGIGESPNFLVLDSDHVLVSPHTFVAEDGRFVLYQSSEYHGPYYRNIARITNPPLELDRFSFISHKMIFNRNRLSELRKKLEHDNPSLGNSWDRIILSSLDMSEGVSPFSEFELYGNFLSETEKIKRFWRQKTLRKNSGKLPSYQSLVNNYSWRNLAVSFPDYRKKK